MAFMLNIILFSLFKHICTVDAYSNGHVICLSLQLKYSQLSRYNTARGSCTRLATVGPTKVKGISVLIVLSV